MTHRVEFADTDLAGIMHFSNFFRWMERTEHAFFRSIGVSIDTLVDGNSYGWPRVRAECEYRHPLRFEDEVEVRLTVRTMKQRSLTYDFDFRLSRGRGSASDRSEDASRNGEVTETGKGTMKVGRIGDGEVAALGSLTVVCVTRNLDGQMAAVRIPPDLADRIRDAVTSRDEAARGRGDL